MPGKDTRYRISDTEGLTLIAKLLGKDQDCWMTFLNSIWVKEILNYALKATCLGNKVTIEDLGNAIYIDNMAGNDSWLVSDKDDPGSIYYYFRKYVRSKLKSRVFIRSLIGFDPKIDYYPVEIDSVTEHRRPFSECYSNEDSQFNNKKIAKKKVRVFKEIIKRVSIRYPKYGELLSRYYIRNEDLHSIAIDFLKRGLIKGRRFAEEELTDVEIQKAHDNLQNSQLPRARDKFNEIALRREFPLLKGKIKKSLLKDKKKAKI